MRNGILNKAAQTAKDPVNKYAVVSQKVTAAIADIDTEAPAIRAEYVQGLEKAQAAQREAQAAKESAESETALDQAIEQEARAREKERFFKRKLDSIDFTPLMPESKYYDLVSSVQSAMQDAAQEYRKEVKKAMDALIEARNRYEVVAAWADRDLRDLDDTARVLQCKYRYRSIQFTGDAPDQLIEDPNEWMRHAVRYLPNEYNKLACVDVIPGEGAKYNDIQVAAWHAVDRVKGIEARRYAV